jgi:hypothetical protein
VGKSDYEKITHHGRLELEEKKIIFAVKRSL